MLNYVELEKKQRELDDYIEKLHPTTDMAGRIRDKKIALCVEAAEFVNETRSFKFWSNLQEATSSQNLIEEYVDVLHFILGLNRHLEKPFITEGNTLKMPLDSKYVNLNDRIVDFLTAASLFMFNQDKNLEEAHYSNILFQHLEFGYALGFTDKQIEDEYARKYQINIERQKQNY